MDYHYHDEDQALYLKLVAQRARTMTADPGVTGEVRTIPRRIDDPNAGGAVFCVTEKMMRTFETGATRDTDSGKHDFRGYLSPLVLKRFGEYMTKHRIQPDGAVRASDNWKRGMPKQEYLSSSIRHLVDLWLLHDGYGGVATQDIEEALCGLLFNVQGYLHTYLEENEWPTFTPTAQADDLLVPERDEVPF